MEEGAAWLCDRVLPLVPLRQWVLSLPKTLRYLLAYNGPLCRAVAGTTMRVISHFLRQQAKRQFGLRSTRLAHPGALVAVQRFGSALNLNIHFHALVLDGVYVLDAFGAPSFFELPQPTLAELDHLAGRIAAAVVELLRRKRIWLDDDEEDDPVAERSPMLAKVARASLSGTLALGPAGSRPVRLQDAKPRIVPQTERAGKALGFVLDAEVRVSAWNRLHRERLCRYLLRPPLAKGRLNETMDGRYAFELKTPWADGTRIIFFSGEELVGRLTALVPPPRMHLVHYYGVLAPNAKLRNLVVPEPPQEEESLSGGATCYEDEKRGPIVRRRWVPWAKLLLKVFGVDVFHCPQCEGRMQRIAFITQPRIIADILECLERKESPP